MLNRHEFSKAGADMAAVIRSLNPRQKTGILLAIDLVLLCVAALIAYGLQPLESSPRSVFPSIFAILPYLLGFAAVASLWMGLQARRLHMYDSRAVGITALYTIAVAAVSAGLSTLAALPVPLAAHAVFGLIYFFLIALSRTVLLQIVQAIYRRSPGRCRVLIYGAGTTGVQLVSAFRSDTEIEPVAFVDDNTALHGLSVANLTVHSPRQIERLVADHKIDRVLLAMPSQTQAKQAQIARRLQELGLEVQTLPSFSQLIGQEKLVDQLTPMPPNAYLGRDVHDLETAAALEQFRGRSILVSGAGGSIGSELCRQLLPRGPRRLVLFELSEAALYTIMMELQQPAEDEGVEIVPVLGTVADARHVRTVLRDHEIQIVLHAAAYKHVPLVEMNPLSGLENNVFSTQTLAREAAEFGVERFILISSDKAVRPTSVMGASKRLAELVVQDIGTRHPRTIFTVVRFGNVLGSSGSVVPLFQEQVRRGGPVTVTDPNVVRYFMTIHEAVQLVLTAGGEARGNEVFVLDMGRPVSILRLARQIIEAAGYSAKGPDNPDGDIEIRVIGLRAGEKLSEELSLTGHLSKTAHRKIYRADEAGLSEIEVALVIRDLRQAVESNDQTAALALLARWVEDYGAVASAVRGG